jgi:hypothetical protein
MSVAPLPFTTRAFSLSVAPHHEHLADPAFEFIHPALSELVRSQINPFEYVRGWYAFNTHFHREAHDRSLASILEGGKHSQSECRLFLANCGVK